MITLKFSFKKERLIPNTDIVKDAFITGIIKTGLVKFDDISGRFAKDFSVSPVIYGKMDDKYLIKDIFVRSIDSDVIKAIQAIKMADVQKEQILTNSIFNLEGATVKNITYPIVSGTKRIPCIFKTPLLLSKPKELGVNRKKNGDRYFINLTKEDLSYWVKRINQIIERKTGKKTNLNIIPDDFYLSCHDYIAKFYPIKNVSKTQLTKIPGLMFPFVLEGDEVELLTALHVGLGEKTKLGFGAFSVIGG